MTFIKNLRLGTRITLLILIPTIVFMIISVNNAIRINKEIMNTFEQRLVVVSDIVKDNVRGILEMKKRGRLTIGDVKEDVIETILNHRYGKDNFFIVLDKDGTILTHRNKEMIGNTVASYFSRSVPFDAFTNWARDVRKNGNGFVYFNWNGERKLTYGVYVRELDWIIVTGSNPDFSPARSYYAFGLMFTETLVVILVLLICSYLLTRSVKMPLLQFADVLALNKKGCHEMRAPNLDKSEIGDLGREMNSYLDKIHSDNNKINQRVQKLVEDLHKKTSK